MKRYKITEGTLLWALKQFWFIITGVLILVYLAFPTTPEVQTALSPPAAITIEEPAKIYDLPLEAELQNHIKDLCDSYEVDMPLVLAVIGQESGYDADVIGDGGKSIGLMQIQKQWHSERMNKLGVDDLLDPYQNVTVGIDILAELLAENDNAEWAVTAYNAGKAAADFNKSIGVRSEYTESVMKLREEIANEQ